MSMQLNDFSVRMQIALPAILLVLVIGAAVWFGLQTQAPHRGKVLVLHPALTSTQDGAVETGAGIEVRLAENPDTNDPFFRFTADEEQSLALVDSVPKELHLTTIADGSNGRYCLINGKVFIEGMAGDGFVVQAIEAALVLISLPHGSFEVAPGQKAAFLGGRLVSLEKVEIVRPDRKKGDFPEAVEPAEDAKVID